jgi:uncharacterized membrane protein HdeD (DUF308 family)
MFVPVKAPTPAVPDVGRWWGVRLVLGIVAIGVGIAAFAWPAATVQVVGLLFGLNLVVTGAVRAVLVPFAPGYPVLYRVFGVIFGVLTVIVGLICVGNVTGSVKLLLIVVAAGWLLDGLTELFLGTGDDGAAGRGWRIAAGLGSIVAAVVVLVWPELTLTTFLAVGAIVLVLVGVVQVVGAVASLRTRHDHPSPSLGEPSGPTAR